MKLLLLLPLILSACTLKLYATPEPSLPVATNAPPSISPLATMTQTEKETFLENRWCPAKAMDVQVANPNTVTIRDQKAKAARNVTKDPQILKFGESCHTESAGLWEAYGMTSEGGVDRVLVMYYLDGPRLTPNSCPTLILSFLDFDDFWRHCTASSVTPEEMTTVGRKKRASAIHDLWERKEKGRVNTILLEKETEK